MAIEKLSHVKIDKNKIKNYFKRTSGNIGNAFYIVPNCFRNHHAEFEIDRTVGIVILKKIC